tara:strand:- start:1589 stop:1795 length:207 start_codon:yes stop_codon:yes gene_type:complete
METTEIILNRLDKIEADVTLMRDNHLRHVELELQRINTTLKIGWKILVFGAGLPAFVSTILSVIQFFK